MPAWSIYCSGGSDVQFAVRDFAVAISVIVQERAERAGSKKKEIYMDPLDDLPEREAVGSMRSEIYKGPPLERPAI